ncbi:MAG: hypothetical protein U0R49_10440 [Fimbriimonadales bacterium]
MPLWPFKKKPTEPVLTINKNFYFSVLASSSHLPTLLQMINPDGSNGALIGFGAPLSEGASRDLLNQSLATGAYVLSTKERSTLVEMHVFQKSQVQGFSLPSDSAVCDQAGLVGDKLKRAQNAQYIINLVIKAFSPELYPSVRFYLDCAARIALLTEGVIADPLSELYRLPNEMNVAQKLDERIDFREVARVKLIRLEDGIWSSTRGLTKFNLPEFEMYGIPENLADIAANMIASAGQQALIGIPMKSGETAFAPDAPLTVFEGTKMRQEWADRPTLEFRSDNGGVAKAVDAWKRFQGL